MSAANNTPINFEDYFKLLSALPTTNKCSCDTLKKENEQLKGRINVLKEENRQIKKIMKELNSKLALAEQWKTLIEVQKSMGGHTSQLAPRIESKMEWASQFSLATTSSEDAKMAPMVESTDTSTLSSEATPAPTTPTSTIPTIIKTEEEDSTTTVDVNESSLMPLPSDLVPEGDAAPVTKKLRKSISTPRTGHKACENCAAIDTTVWRKDTNNRSVCNACGLYDKKHKTPRPMRMKSNVIYRRTSRGSKAPPTTTTADVKPSNETTIDLLALLNQCAPSTSTAEVMPTNENIDLSVLIKQFGSPAATDEVMAAKENVDLSELIKQMMTALPQPQ